MGGFPSGTIKLSVTVVDKRNGCVPFGNGFQQASSHSLGKGGKDRDVNMSRIDGLYTNRGTLGNVGFGRERPAKAGEARKGESLKSVQGAISGKTEKTSSLQLSEKAQKMLDKLKEKYGDKADIMVADYGSEEEARGIMSRGTKEYSVLLSEDELEKMADDEAYEEENYSKIESAMDMGKKLKEELEGNEDTVLSRFGISFNSDGTTSFFAELEQASERTKSFNEGMKAQKEADKEAQAKEQERASARKERAGGPQEKGFSYGLEKNPPKKTVLTGASEEELIEGLKNLDWSKITTEKAASGGKVDFSI